MKSHYKGKRRIERGRKAPLDAARQLGLMVLAIAGLAGNAVRKTFDRLSSKKGADRPARLHVRRVKVALVTAVVVLGGLIASAAAASANQVLSGITVGGVSVSGLQGRPLLSKLQPAARALERREIELVVGKRSWKRTPEHLGISVDLNKSAERALKAGRTDPLRWLVHSIGAGHSDIEWIPKIDHPKFKTALDELAREVKVEPANGDVLLEAAEVTVKPPSEGVSLEKSAARSSLIQAAVNPPKNDRLSLPVTITAPDVSIKEAAKVQEQAQNILSAPAEFIFETRSLAIPPEGIAASLRTTVVEKPDKQASLELTVDPEALRSEIVKRHPGANRLPKNASFSVAGDKVSVLPGSDGATPDTEAVVAAVVALGENRLPIALPTKVTPASLSTDAAMSLGIKSKISTFTTLFDPQNAPRVANIDRMASAIDGKVLRPGETYSLNASTGARTPANGYQEAQIIVDGELVPGIGGGVCQVATTLFNAVFMAGLDVVQRSNHSLHISKYPLGRDAMVSFGQQDLRFRNDTQFGMLLKASLTAKAMTVSIYSSPLGRTVETATSPTRNPTLPTTKTVDDPTIPAGQQVVAEQGTAGFEVTVTRKVTGDGKILHDDTFVSKYRPWKRVIKNGTGPAVAPAVPAVGPALPPNPAIPPALPPA